MSFGSKIPVVIFASGAGTGFATMADAIAVGRLPAELRGLVCDQPGAPVLQLARERGVPTICCPREKGEARDAYETRLLAAIGAWAPHWVVLSGFMRVLGPIFLKHFLEDASSGSLEFHRVLNVHPSLLPAFAGLDGYGQAFRHGVKLAGVTVHLVDASLDGGPICAQEAFAIEGTDSLEDVIRRGKEVEHRLYPATLSWLLQKKFRVESRGGRQFVRTH